jgi:CubicO group peptidase (beta-lactamase class C family)
MWRALAVLVAAGLIAACGGNDAGNDGGGAQDDGGPATGDRASGDQASGCDAGVADGLAAWADAGFSGTIAVTTAGEPDCLAAYGTADEATDTANTVDTVFAIGSVSKAFTAAAVLDLVDAGHIRLDDRAGDLVTGLAGPAADATVEQLLLHTSGLTGDHGSDHEPLDRDAAVAAIGGLDLAFEPGTEFLYSNAGYTLLALIVDEATGGYREHQGAETLALPGGGTAGGFWDGEPAAPGPRAVGHLDDGLSDRPSDQLGDFPGPHWALDGNGDLAMTTRDLAAWTHALFTGGIVGPGAVDLLDELRFDQGDGAAEAPGWVALDAEALGEPVLAASGGGGDVGHDVIVAWLPESERVVAAASNTPDVTAEQLLQAVGPALVAGEPLPAPEVVGDVDPADAAAVAGTYELASGGSLTVEDGDGRLAVRATGADAVAALFPLAEDGEAAEDGEDGEAAEDGEDGGAAEAIAAHEQAVAALLRGETQTGREELAALEADLGPIDGFDLAGTVSGQEVRTYVTLRAGGTTHLLWYALDDEGGVAAAEVGTDPPGLLLGTTEDGTGFRPDDPTATGPDVTVTFAGGTMTVESPAGTTTAHLAA